MGLLSFRKKSSNDETSTDEQSVEESTDVIGSNLSNDDWLAGVERRDEKPPAAPQAHDPSYDYPVVDEALPAAPAFEPADVVADHYGAAEQFDSAAEQLAEVQQTVLQTPTPAAPTLQNGPAFPDMGIVYAGLENEGLAAFPSEAPPQAAPAVEEPAALQQPADIPTPPVPPAFGNPAVALTPDAQMSTTIEHGPVGPEATEPLQTLGLAPGCSWQQVAETRVAILDAVPNTGAPEEQQARAEVNHAAATLRLLRAGSLKA